jgi:hypothetical protein
VGGVGRITVGAAEPDLTITVPATASGNAKWQCYSGRNYTGTAIVLDPTSAHYTSTSTSTRGFLSVRPVMITLFNKASGSPPSITLYESADTLMNFNDKTYSVEAVGGTWELYTNKDYGGHKQTIHPSTSQTLSSPLFAGTISSVKLKFPS